VQVATDDPKLDRITRDAHCTCDRWCRRVGSRSPLGRSQRTPQAVRQAAAGTRQLGLDAAAQARYPRVCLPARPASEEPGKKLACSPRWRGRVQDASSTAGSQLQDCSDCFEASDVRHKQAHSASIHSAQEGAQATLLTSAPPAAPFPSPRPQPRTWPAQPEAHVGTQRHSSVRQRHKRAPHGVLSLLLEARHRDCEEAPGRNRAERRRRPHPPAQPPARRDRSASLLQVADTVQGGVQLLAQPLQLLLVCHCRLPGVNGCQRSDEPLLQVFEAKCWQASPLLTMLLIKGNALLNCF